MNAESTIRFRREAQVQTQYFYHLLEARVPKRLLCLAPEAMYEGLGFTDLLVSNLIQQLGYSLQAL